VAGNDKFRAALEDRPAAGDADDDDNGDGDDKDKRKRKAGMKRKTGHDHGDETNRMRRDDEDDEDEDDEDDQDREKLRAKGLRIAKALGLVLATSASIYKGLPTKLCLKCAAENAIAGPVCDNCGSRFRVLLNRKLVDQAHRMNLTSA
jgi:hypothetical protein